MSDLVIAALSGAGVTVTVAIAMLYLGIRLSDAEQSASDARVDAATRKGQGASDAALIAQLRAELQLTKTRADALDDLCSQLTANDAVGAHARVLARWKGDVPAKPAAGGSAAEPVHPASDAAPADESKPVG